jgi:hypothetical protein
MIHRTFAKQSRAFGHPTLVSLSNAISQPMPANLKPDQVCKSSALSAGMLKEEMKYKLLGASSRGGSRLAVRPEQLFSNSSPTLSQAQ